MTATVFERLKFRNRRPPRGEHAAGVARYSRALGLLGAVLAVWAVLGWAVLIERQAALTQAQQGEQQRRLDYQKRRQQAARVPALQQQLTQAQQQLQQLQQQLPAATEMDALLADIHQAGRRRNVRFDWFKPELPSVRTHYVEWPIAVRITGRYHDIAGFVADLAQLSRLVTLHNWRLEPVAPASESAEALVLEGRMTTYRRLTEAEQAAVVTPALTPALTPAPVASAVASSVTSNGPLPRRP